ncbi:bifunctional diguanylate cyclase/phosphodiesterase [Holdemania massiliensis]|uniref:bifunctional diguanylate cyclase/phosphodiesterase n=1 Tax=Holdemania massiliensis TaxID=1468449 RepID=UPI00242C2890|nr:GGDEF and EAL domain-containing protein [Holdemania massiliensis]
MRTKRISGELQQGLNRNEKWGILGQILVFALMLLGVILLMQRLRMAIDRKTQSYLTDVAMQNAYRIDERFHALQQNLEWVKEHLKHETEDRQPAFLLNAADLLGFDTLSIQPGEAKAGVYLCENQQIEVTIPMEDQRQLTGRMSQRRIQRMIQSQSFGGESLSCIADAQGKVIISPTSLAPFMKLDEIFVEKRDAKVIADIEQMQQRMLRGERGVIQFTARDQSEQVLSYIPIQNGKWVLLTLVPAAYMSREVDLYAFWNCVVLGLLLVFCALILLLSLYRGWKHRRRLNEIAFVDDLTKAPNHSGFQMLCRHRLETAGSLGQSILFINLKHFKLINESYRSETGDQVLKIFMECLLDSISEQEVAGRIEADHFALLVRGQDFEQLRVRMNQLQKAVQAKLTEQKIGFSLTFNAGFYAMESPSQDIQVMLGRAKTACWSAEKQDLLICQYDQKLIDALRYEHALSEAFPEALRSEQFMIVLQPKVDPQTERVAGAEALIRWKHPEKGMMPPTQFIPVFENNGLIVQLDTFVFEHVCRQLAAWQKAGKTQIPISVNLSRHHFKSLDFLSHLQTLAARYQVDPHLIELEITESIFFDEPSIERVKQIVHQIHQAGFTCSLDDFGSGYSSLGLLKEFEIDAIKLDRVFFPEVLDRRSRVVIEGIIALAKNLNLEIVAEGVEHADQAAFLREIGCDRIQGYYYSPPLAPDAFDSLREQMDQGCWKSS